ncbi:MAG TPA: hypothetical protein VIP06_05550, partial [Nocardioides sp.]
PPQGWGAYMSDSEDLQATFAREDAARMLDAQRRMQDGVASYAQLTAATSAGSTSRGPYAATSSAGCTRACTSTTAGR